MHCTVHCTVLCYALYIVLYCAMHYTILYTSQDSVFCLYWTAEKISCSCCTKSGDVSAKSGDSNKTVLYSTVLYCTVMLYCKALANICLDIFVLSVLNHCSAKLNFSFKAARMCDLGLPRSQNADYTVQYSTFKYSTLHYTTLYNNTVVKFSTWNVAQKVYKLHWPL